jgi:hypothetical protein
VTGVNDPQAAQPTAVDEAARLLRRLIPFPSSGDLSSLEIPLMPARPSGSRQSPPPAAGQPAAAIISQAASILDEEMARGALAAREASQSARDRNSTPRGDLLRMVHDVVDNIAEIWPTLQAAPDLSKRSSNVIPKVAQPDPIVELEPPAIRSGQRALVSMTLCNKEEHAVRLTPASTDLVGSSGGRISSQFVDFAPGEVRLEPGEQIHIQIAVRVPSDCAVGCYTGLVVVTGVDYLRAIMTIEVV